MRTPFSSALFLALLAVSCSSSVDQAQDLCGLPSANSGKLTAPAIPPRAAKTIPPFKWVTGYYTAWSLCQMPPQWLDFAPFTHLIYFASEPTNPEEDEAIDPETGQPTYFSMYSTVYSASAGGTPAEAMELGPEWCRQNYGNDLIRMSHENNVKILLSLGGEWGDHADYYHAIANDADRLGKFIRGVSKYAFNHCYDGVEVDWEWPEDGDQPAVTNLLTGLRTCLDLWAESPRPADCAVDGYSQTSVKGELALAVDKSPMNDTYDPAVVNGETTPSGRVDQINLMAYGMDYYWSSITHSNHASLNSPIDKPTTYDFNVTDAGDLSTIQYYNGRNSTKWADTGYDPDIVGMLIPFEGKHLTVYPGEECGWYCGGYASYREVLAAMAAHPGSEIWDPAGQVHYLLYTDGSDKHFWTYDDEESIAAKVQWAVDTGITGIGIWDIWRGWLSTVEHETGADANPPAGYEGNPDPLLRSLKTALGL